MRARIVLAGLALSTNASAGGFEIPDLGTEALARGGAFTAKADDATAVHHNVAGLAQQRGTHLYASTNASWNQLAFQRTGVYDSGPAAGEPFPRVENQGGAAIIPVVAATSDFGLDRTTFALAFHGPPAASLAARTFPIGLAGGAPSPVRYDAIGGTSSTILFYTAAMGLKLSDAVHVGLGVSLVSASLETRSTAYVDTCATSEDARCDARFETSSKGFTGTGSLGFLAHLGGGASLGLAARGPVIVQTEGDLHVTAPRAAQVPMPESRVIVRTALPWVFRAGIRKEIGEGDLELDATYETWSTAQDPGPRALLERTATERNAERIVAHHYKDTFSIRAGGSTKLCPLTLRAGAFYDASATDSSWTRVDVDTLAKIAATGGLGVKLGPVRLDVGYAAVFDVGRTVTDGALVPTKGIAGDRKTPELPVNDGQYSGFTHLASAAIGVELEDVFRTTRPKTGKEISSAR